MNAIAKQVHTTRAATTVETQGATPSMIVSTATVDRDGDRVMPEGADFKNFLRNPVLCWSHAHSDIPIGSVTHLAADAIGIKIYWKWLQNDPLANRVRNAWEQGVVRAASIGFLPRRAVRNEYGGQDHREWELIEISLCAIPANPQAVRTLKSLGLWDERAMDGDDRIDWNAINKSSEPDIDWDRIELPDEVNVSTGDVDRVLAAFAPALLDGVRAGLKVQAGLAAERIICRMTGRLD
ncbi:MAG: HK97 family phage prohead protease [Nitrospira sp.]|nr:HK97 family phage prohead protease [Nitrospira sp.]